MNIPADLLSRKADYLTAISSMYEDFMDKMKEEQVRDPALSRYREYAAGSHVGFRFKSGWLYTAKD